jgi:hypothetical protein
VNLTNRDYGNLCRKVLMLDISKNYKDLIIEGSWWRSPHDDIKILTLYSSLNDDRWFYGIIEKYWKNWDKDSHIVFLMRDGKYCSYVLLNPTESNNLLSRINLSKDNSKKINVRIPAVGKIYIQEWQDFPYENRIKHIGNINPEEAGFEKLAKIIGISVEALKKAFAEVLSKS